MKMLELSFSITYEEHFTLQPHILVLEDNSYCTRTRPRNLFQVGRGHAASHTPPHTGDERYRSLRRIEQEFRIL